MEHPTPPRLSLLKTLLYPQPPSLQQLVELTHGAEDYKWFRQLVHNILPDQADRILHQSDPPSQVETFSQLFGKAFFPLPDYYTDDLIPSFDQEVTWSAYGMIRQGAPIPMMGISIEDLHEIWHHWQPGIAALASLDRPQRALGRHPKRDQDPLV